MGGGERSGYPGQANDERYRAILVRLMTRRIGLYPGQANDERKLAILLRLMTRYLGLYPGRQGTDERYWAISRSC